MHHNSARLLGRLDLDTGDVKEVVGRYFLVSTGAISCKVVTAIASVVITVKLPFINALRFLWCSFKRK